MSVWSVIMFCLAVVIAVAIFFSLFKPFIIGPEEFGVLIRLGKIKKVLEPGLHFRFVFFDKLLKYSKKPKIFRFKLKTAMCRNGKVKNYKEDGKEIERTDLKVVLVLTTFFDPKKIQRIVETAPGNDTKSLGPAIEPFVLGILRSVVSEIPWPLFNGERSKVGDYILSKMIPDFEYYEVLVENEDDETKPNSYRFKNEKDGPKSKSGDESSMKTNPLVQFGFDLSRTTVEIEDVDFADPKITEALSLSEQARLKGDADVIASEAEARIIKNKNEAEIAASVKRIKEEGSALAEARREMIEEIKDNPDLEYLKTLEQMAKGTSNTILYQIPKSFEEKVSKIMGGSKPEDYFNFFNDEKVLETLKTALEKITKK